MDEVRALAQNHCQIGNTGLALDTMMRWVENFTGIEIDESANSWICRE